MRPRQEGDGASDGDGVVGDDGGHPLHVCGEVAVRETDALGGAWRVIYGVGIGGWGGGVRLGILLWMVWGIGGGG